MADTDTGEKGFVFGQNMGDRAIQPRDGDKTDSSHGEENGTSEKSPEYGSAESSAHTGSRSGILAPGRLGSNPFIPASSHLGEGILSPGRMAANPFASRPPVQAVSYNSPYCSDSDEEKKEKPILAPATFHVGAPKIVVSDEKIENSSPKVLLRPSALSSHTVNFGKTSSVVNSPPKDSEFILKPATFQNSLSNNAKEDRSSPDDTDKPDDENKPPGNSSNSANSEEVQTRLFGDSCNSQESKDEKKENLFSHFIASNKSEADASANGASASSNSGGSFLFGQNMDQRVENAVASNGTSAEPLSPTEKEANSPTVKSPTSAKTLAESANAYQAKQAKPEFQEVSVVTGEENESNVLQAHVKLFVFEKPTQSWLERGRGLLRLNDMTGSDDSCAFQSRLIMRTQGSLRVVLNTKVWAGMTVDRASQKSVRITARGEEGIKVFLIMASIKEADQIFRAIDWRVQQLKTQEDHTAEVSQGEKRRTDSPERDSEGPAKKARVESESASEEKTDKHVDPDQRRDVITEESNDSSTVDPETEASCESYGSSPTIKSSSSEF